MIISEGKCCPGARNNICRLLECFPLPFTPHPSLIFVGKDRSLQLERSSVKGSTLIGSSLAQKYQTRQNGSVTAYYDAETIIAIKVLQYRHLMSWSCIHNTIFFAIYEWTHYVCLCQVFRAKLHVTVQLNGPQQLVTRKMKCCELGPLVLLLIFMQRHLVKYFGNSSGKTKHYNMFEIKFASHLNCYHHFKLFFKKCQFWWQ